MRDQFLRKVLVVFALALFLSPLSAQRLPLKTYTAADGLATSITHYITRDSEGFLWFAGRGGLSRFDGAEFLSYQFSETESAPLVHFFLESRDGKYFWLATDNGLYRAARRVETPAVQPAEQRPLREGVRRMRAKKVFASGFWGLHEMPDGTMLAGSINGLYAVENVETDEVAVRKLEYSKTAEAEKRNSVREFADARDGSIWIATDAGLVRRTPDGRFLTYDVPRVLPVGDEALSVRVDSAQRVWIVFRTGVFVLAPEPLEAVADLPNLTARVMPVEEFKLGDAGEVELPEKPGSMIKLDCASFDGRAGRQAAAAVQDTFQSSDGKIWIPTADALVVFTGNRYERLRDADALPGLTRRVIEDASGNLWFGTFSGVIKLVRGGLTSFAASSGLTEPNIHLIQETPAGELLVVHGNWRVSRLLPGGFATSLLNLPENARYSWTSFPVVGDAAGSLWSLQTAGLFRFPPKASFEALVRQTPEKVSLNGEIFKDRFYYRAFNDRAGNFWVSANSTEPARRALLRFSPQTGEWRDLSNAPGFPKNRLFASFAEDAAGNLWFGFSGSSGLVKYDGERFTEIAAGEDLPRGSIFALLVDRRGRLWVSSNERGVTRVDDPAAEKPAFVRYTENEGLSSNNVRCLTEDLNGNIYAGTVRGVSEIDPETGQIRQLTTADGLAADFVQAAFRDRRGTLWFGTSNGLSKYEPASETPLPAPPIFISGLKIAGVDYGVSELGQTEVGGIETSAAENNLQIDFTSIGDAAVVRYQFKLEGAGVADWSAPTGERRVNFANLAPGNYRFLVRAVNRAGAASERAATVAFLIRPPFWRAWWFLSLSALFVSLILLAVYRYRTENLRRVNAALSEAKRAEEELSGARQERLKELDRVRRRIATDLHDDIGSSLTQIAVLSEVARTQAAIVENETLAAPLERIKGVSRELVEAMSDVVWAINPAKDNLRDLVQRMRLFASDVCAARGIHFELDAPPIETALQLGANVRREVFAIFKESVNNAVKYSGARRIDADFRIEGERLVLEIADDGRGFDAETVLSEDFEPESGGNGLVNMRRRARELGGTCSITSTAGKGTTVRLEAPLIAPEI